MQLQTAVPNDVLRCIMCSAGLPESDEGRAWCGARQSCMTCELDAYDSIADELGKAQDERFDNEMWKQGYDAGFASADDWLGQHEDAMAKHGWVRLPKDADGEYIRVGDVMVSDGGAKGTVTSIAPESIVLDHSSIGSNPKAFHHYHAPTVEDVLHRLVGRAQALDCAEDEDKLVAEYAAKLRLAEGDAE